MKLPTLEEAFDTIRAVAREHAMTQDAGTCLCKHINSVHRSGGWGSCSGDGGKCQCPRFRGIHWHRARAFERFGVQLVARLRDDQAAADLAKPGGSDQATPARERKPRKTLSETGENKT